MFSISVKWHPEVFVTENKNSHHILYIGYFYFLIQEIQFFQQEYLFYPEYLLFPGFFLTFPNPGTLLIYNYSLPARLFHIPALYCYPVTPVYKYLHNPVIHMESSILLKLLYKFHYLYNGCIIYFIIMIVHVSTHYKIHQTFYSVHFCWH